MDITHVITRLIVGGAQENTVSSVLGLRRKPGLRVDLISGPTTGPEGTLEPVFEDHPGCLTVVPDLIRPVRPLADLRAYRALFQRFRATRPDIVHTHSGKAGFVGRLAAHRAGVPCVVHTIHGPSFGPFQGAGANTAFTLAERLAGRVTDHFVVVADAMTRQYLEAGIGRPDQYTRIFSGFDLDPYLSTTRDPELGCRLGLGPDDIVVGMVARLFELKGHDDLFSVAPALVKRHPRLKFLLVGDGPWRGRFEARAQEPDLRGRVVFSGLVPPSVVPSMVGQMDLLIHLSRREGLPRALPQALAAGRPVVAYDCDGSGEVCLEGRTGFLVPPGNLDRLEECLEKLIRDPGLRERLGGAGREWVSERFRVETMVAALATLYERLDPRGGRPGAR